MADETFIKVDNQISRSLGATCAVIYGLIRETYSYWKERGELVDGYCYLTMNTIHARTLYSRRTQENAIKSLVANGYVKRKVCGMPRKQFFMPVCHILQTCMSDIANKNATSSKQECHILQTCMSDIALTKTREERLDSNTREATLETTLHTREPMDEKMRELIQDVGVGLAVVTPSMLGLIESDVETYGLEWVHQAVKYSARNKARSWKYVQVVLASWARTHEPGSKPWEEVRMARSTGQSRIDTINRVMARYEAMEDDEDEAKAYENAEGIIAF